MRRLMLLALALVAGCDRLDRVAMGFAALLQGVDVSATLTAENGQEYYLESPMQAWALDGAVSSSPELSACVSSAGNAEAPVGTVIKSVHIKSDKPLPVLGVYWQSMPKLS